jgi:hypothetical protein
MLLFTIFEIDFFCQVHLAGDGLEDESFLATIWCRELNLSIQATYVRHARTL